MAIDTQINPKDMQLAAAQATRVLKTLSHKDRLLILCELNEQERSVSQLCELLEIPQSPISQHLSRMRKEGLVKTRREAQNVFYSINSHEVSSIIATLYSIYCEPENQE